MRKESRKVHQLRTRMVLGRAQCTKPNETPEEQRVNQYRRLHAAAEEIRNVAAKAGNPELANRAQACAAQARRGHTIPIGGTRPMNPPTRQEKRDAMRDWYKTREGERPSSQWQALALDQCPLPKASSPGPPPKRKRVDPGTTQPKTPDFHPPHGPSERKWNCPRSQPHRNCEQC